MNPWRQFPLLRLILPVVLGIGAGIFLDKGISPPLGLLGAVFCGYGLLALYSKTILPYSLRWIVGVAIFILFFMLFFRIMMMEHDARKLNYFGNLGPLPRFYSGEIIEPVIRKEKCSKIILEITAAKKGEKWITAQGKAMVLIGIKGQSQLLYYGDRIVIRASFREPEGPQNPGSFDNRRYLMLKGINRQAYVKPGEWKLTGRKVRNPVVRLALGWRDQMLSILRSNGLTGREFAVAGALLLGYVDEVDNELMADYSATGVMHILSVSGMHVGMIFLVLEKLLSFLSRRKYGKYLQSVLIIVFIWLYALITGLSPAVMRAAAMLSLLIAGKTMKRNPDVLNILAASALFLLVWQPFLLVDLGFQLSYLAVAGIVLLYKPVYDVFVTSNWLLDKIWSIMAVSIAAQLATLPVCLYYFHQFPNYFLLTNIVVIPLSNLIIYTGILALATGYIPWLSIVIARMLSFLVWFLNTFIHRMGALPFSVSRGIVLTIPESLMMYGILITLGLFISGKKKIWLFAAFIPAILLSGSFLVDHYHQYSRKEFVVYDVKKSGLYDFTAGGKSILAGDLSVVKDPFFADILKKSRWISRTKGLFDFQYPDHDLSTKPFAHDGIFYKRGRFLQFYNKRIMIIDHPLPKGVRQRIKVSYLVISGNPRVKLKELLRHIRTDEIIFDPSNSLSKIKSWTKEAHGLGVRCFSVTESGAFNVVF